MDLTSHPPNPPSPALMGTMSRADVAAHTAASYVRTTPAADGDTTCECGAPLTRNHTCSGPVTR